MTILEKGTSMLAKFFFSTEKNKDSGEPHGTFALKTAFHLIPRHLQDAKNYLQ